MSKRLRLALALIVVVGLCTVLVFSQDDRSAPAVARADCALPPECTIITLHYTPNSGYCEYGEYSRAHAAFVQSPKSPGGAGIRWTGEYLTLWKYPMGGSRCYTAGTQFEAGWVGGNFCDRISNFPEYECYDP
ncbi:MAG: hypothetical protein R6V05_14065 [Candidatus Brocadiia bacterium]